MSKNVWDLVNSVISHSRTTLLYGVPGTGKSHAAHSADLGGRNLYSVTVTPETPAAELRGHYIPVGNEFKWQDGPAISAWVSAHHRHGVRGADECGWSRFSPSWRSAVAPA